MINPPKRKRGESGNSLFLGTVALIYIIPLMGLAIDASFLYAVKGRLQAAIDGASLGAARALNLGQTLSSQQTNASQNAVNWFYANFPPNTWATFGTNMSNGTVTQNNAGGFYSANVNIYPDMNNAQLDHVDLTASTKVPTWFMHWFGLTSTTLNVKSSATRRAAVIMMVLDRSGSMCAPVNSGPCTKTDTTTACAKMISASKQFTGQFAEGRDYIGLITFSSGVYVVVPPTKSSGIPDTSFQSTLGYTSTFGSSNGALDNITCDGYTNTSEAVSLGYSLLYQTQLPGALNILLVETDGLPNSMTLNFLDSTNLAPQVGLQHTSGCTDNNTPNRKLSSGTPGFNTYSVIPSWGDQFSLNLQAAPFGTTATPLANSSIPKGMVAVFASDDPNSSGNGTNLILSFNPWNNPNAQLPQVTNPTGNGWYNSWLPAQAQGCAFDSNYHNGTSSNPPDIKWFPQTDVFGNQLKPSTNPYVTTNITGDGSGHYVQNGWRSFHSMALNAADNAAYNARANATIPAYVFTLGLGGNSSGLPLDPILLQRMANDPNGDEFNVPATYSACNLEPTCVNYGKPQLQGTFVYAPDSDSLAQAFLRISSQILRLNQ